MITSIHQRRAVSKQICEEHPEILDALEAASTSRDDAMNKVDNGTYASFFLERQVEVPLGSAVLNALYARQDRERGVVAALPSVSPQYTLDEWETAPYQEITQKCQPTVERENIRTRPRKVQLDELLEKLDYDEALIEEIRSRSSPTHTYDEEGNNPVVLTPVELKYMMGAARRFNETRGDAFRVPNMRVFRSREEREKEEVRKEKGPENTEESVSEQVTLERIARKAHPALTVFKWVYYRNARERQSAVTISHSHIRCSRHGPCDCDFHLSFQFPGASYSIDLIPRTKQGRKQTNQEMFETLGHLLQRQFNLEGPRVVRKEREQQINWSKRRDDAPRSYPLPDATLFQLLQHRYKQTLEARYEEGVEATQIFISPQVLRRMVMASGASPFVKWLFAKEKKSSHICLAATDKDEWQLCIVWKGRVLHERLCPVREDLISHLMFLCDQEYGIESSPFFFPALITPPGILLLLAELSSQYDKVSVLAENGSDRRVVEALLKARQVDFVFAHECLLPPGRVCVDFRRRVEMLDTQCWVASAHRARKCYRYVANGLVFHASMDKVFLLGRELQGDLIEWVDW